MQNWARAVAATLLLICVGACSETDQAGPPLRVVSWGGQFQADLMTLWVGPAAKSIKVPLQTEAWDGDYGALTTRIDRKLNTWDMIHVESIYVMNPRFTELFESFPGRQLETLSGSIKADSTLSALVRDGFAAPVLEYAYLVAGRSDLIGGRDVATLSWKDFWDIENIQGGRGLRDFPVGNIEAALASLGHDPRTYLYAETDPAKLRFKLDEALARLTRLLPAVIWWKTGDKLQQGLESGDMTLAGAWSGRVLAAFRVRCPAAKQLTDCPIGANPNTALISTDWWIIPKGVAGKDNANRLLVELFAPRNRGNAAEFAARQGYSVPISEHNPKDPIAKYFLELGSSDNSKATRLDEKFWGRSFDDINRIWLEWRARS